MLMLLFAAFLQGAAPAPRPLDRGAQSNVDEARCVAVRSVAEWKKLWQAHSPDRPAPAVDFAREMVVAVFLGSRPTAGYGVEIVGTRQEAGALVVEYRVTAPPPGAMTAQVITSPYALAAVPKFDGEVKFTKAS